MNSFDEIHRTLTQLVNENKALHTQAKLIDSFVAIVRSSTKKRILKPTLQKILEFSINIVQAETGSMFFFDHRGRVKEKILTQKDINQKKFTTAIGRSLDRGLAGWVIRHRKIGVIQDTLRDERWISHPDQIHQVRSALAIPIQREERLLGLITLQHSQPYKFNQEKNNLMQATADQIALALENIELYAKLERSYRELNEAKEKVDEYSQILAHELNKGRNIQKEFFPERAPIIAGWEFRSFFKPAMQLSGDFYDIFPILKKQVGIVIADVCDKGVGAALYMALFRSLLRIFSGSFNPYSMLQAEPEKVSQEALRTIMLTNNYIATLHNQMATFATIFMGIIDIDSGELTYINAGHDPPAILRKSGAPEVLMPTGPAAGAFADAQFKINRTQLDPGDVLFGFTDGVTDALSPTGEAFGRNRLDALMDQPADTVRAFEEILKKDLFDHIGDAAPIDDITILMVKRLAN